MTTPLRIKPALKLVAPGLSFPKQSVSTVEPAPLPDNWRTVVWLHRKGQPIAIVGRWA